MHCDFSLDLSHRNGSNEGIQCIFWLRNKKNGPRKIIPEFPPYLSAVCPEFASVIRDTLSIFSLALFFCFVFFNSHVRKQGLNDFIQ